MWGTFRKNSVAICLAVLCFAKANAQDKRPPIYFGAMQQLGLAFESERDLALVSISNGIRWHDGKIYTGLGVSYESGNSYYYSLPKSLPTFIDARYYLFKKKWLFGMANAGVNFIIDSRENLTNNEFYRQHYKNGMYGSLGAGMKARIGKEVYYTFDLCYNFKQTKFINEQLNHLDIWTTEKVDVRQWRVILRMGIELF